MARWTPIPIAGGDYEDDTRPQSCQETVNYLPVKAERPGTRADWILRPVPGMSLFAVVGDGPIRGSRDVEGKLFVVSGSELYRVYGAGSSELLGTIPGVGRVSMTHNQITGGNELVIGNGSSGYVYNTATEVLTQITDEGFPGFRMADFIDGYIWGTEPLGRFGFHSDLADATSYNTLDRTEAEALPDRIVGHIASHGEVLVLSERSGEFFTNTGAGTGTFQRMDGTSLEVGCASWASIAKLDNSPFWMGNDGILYRLNGYQAMPISTGPMAQAFSKVDLSKCFATVYEDKGHKIYYLTSQDGQTWGYDVTTGEVHRRETYGYNRWRLNTLTKWAGKWIGGDFNSGKLYELQWGLMKEGDDPLVRRRVSGVLHDNGNRLTVNAIRVEMDTGLPQVDDAPELSIDGNLPDGYVGDVVSYQYTVGGDLPPFTVDLIAGALPTGLDVDVAGLVTGTTTTVGAFTWTLRVTDADGNTATVTDTAVIGLALTLTPTTLTAGHECDPYSQVITISGGTLPYTLGTVTGLPTGGAASLLGDQLTVTWPGNTAPATYDIQFNVTDAATGLNVFDQAVEVTPDSPILGATYNNTQPHFSATTYNVPVPAGAVPGCLLVLAVCSHINSVSIGFPVGWTVVHNDVGLNAFAYKTYAGETSVTITKTGTTRPWRAVMLAIDGTHVASAYGDANTPGVTLTTAAATNKVFAFVFDVSRTGDTYPPAIFVPESPGWSFHGYSWRNDTGVAGETYPQVQVFTRDCLTAAGDVTLEFGTTPTPEDAIGMIEVAPL